MKQKICIIWSSSGVGKALSEYYHAQGDEVDDITRQDYDLGESDDITKLGVHLSEKQYDILIYSAGIWYYKVFESLTDTEIQEQISVNTTAPLKILQSLSKDTKFVYLSSIMRYIPAKNMSVYASMKQATSQTLRTLKNENPERNILNIDLWAMKTPMHLKAGMQKTVGQDVERILPKLVKVIETKQGSVILLWQWKFLVYIVFPLLRIFSK